MKYIKFLLLGTFFGIVLSKAEIISWYRIYEMFKFASFHMYGVIGSAVALGILGIKVIEKNKLRSLAGNEIRLSPKEKGFQRYLIGGIIFGLGWSMTGACPGPMFILLGHGIGVFLVVIASAVAGTLVYGLIRKKLPH